MKRILKLTAQSEGVDFFKKWLNGKESILRIDGLRASGRSMFFASLLDTCKVRMIVVMDDAEEASYAYNDLATLFSHDKIAVLPSSFKKSPKHGEPDVAAEILRTDALNLITEGSEYIILTSPAGLAELTVSESELVASRTVIHVGDNIEIDDLTERLDVQGFEEVEFVYQPGQYSVRGSIFDVFSFSNEQPYRIDFFGTEVESIRTFDIEKQLSVEKHERVDIVPNTRETISKKRLISLFDYIKKDVIICYNNYDHIRFSIKNIYEDALNSENHTMNPAVFDDKSIMHSSVLLRRSQAFGDDLPIAHFEQEAQPLFHKNFDLVEDTLKNLIGDGYEIYICSDSVKQTDRIAAIFEQRADGKENAIRFSSIVRTLHEGYIDRQMHFVCFTDHQIFDRFHRFTLRSDIARAGKAAMTLKEINELQIGDFVVHTDHGIGRFGGLVVFDENGKRREAIKLFYRDNDVLYVSLHALHKVSKYKGKDGEPPLVSKLGSGAWDALKERTKKKIKDIARDLIRLYAKRCEEQGFRFSKDDYMQHELEASFAYEDTIDQAKATADIKRDMESARPMDRLVCGDVGFGKTEIAIRAAFKAALNGKQVAVLVPTTVLSLQHYKTFSERLKEFPVRVEYLSRARKPADVKKIKTLLAEGKIDILIGTHKIVGKDIKFKDLGLLIIDEEQKFGVSVKEKLKQLKVNVDTLTLTATPIPRTLQFSLMGARDLSILNTAPPNRYPVTTEWSIWDPILIGEAINNEINRNGQVFFIHNRVQSIEMVAAKIRQIVPSARIAIAHGQLPTDELEQIILDFIDYEYDVLVATSVVESGVDIPNVNTMIVNNAHMFGLSDLHQLRGRVGRSNRKAYCYLLTPELRLLTEDARLRLKAIETFSELGSGFNIAMQDLDIRGAGNILGAEQSGFITNLGFETYQQILNEALVELHAECGDEMGNIDTSHLIGGDCQIETDLGIMFPTWYVSSQTERVVLYRELDSIQSEESLSIFIEKLVDRFGPIPDEADMLFDSLRLRWTGNKLGFEKIILKVGKMRCYLPEMNSFWYNCEFFTRMLDFAKLNYKTCKIEQKDNHGLFIVDKIYNVADALTLLNSFLT